MTNVPSNPFTGTVYQGENAAALEAASRCHEWATFLQWTRGGYAIKKGEHGVKIRAFPIVTTRDEKTGKVEERRAPRSYVVFNREQVTN